MRLFRRRVSIAAALGAWLTVAAQGAARVYADRPGEPPIATPNRHVILIIGVNRTLDQVLGTFTPKHGRRVSNLSEGILNAEGAPGPNFDRAQRRMATDTGRFSIHSDETDPQLGFCFFIATRAPPARR